MGNSIILGTPDNGIEIKSETIYFLKNGKRTSLEEMTKNVPVLELVGVVRCKDCLWARPKDHREPTDTPREFMCQCCHHHYIPAPWGARMAVEPDDFCSYGERKDNG